MSTQRRDYRDVIGGLILIAIGLSAAIYTMASYDLGTPQQMGPGMFPALLGGTMAGLGVLILIPAMFRAGGTPERVAWRPLILVGASVATFALTVRPFGLLPAIVLMTLCATFAEGKLGIGWALLLGGVLAAMAILIFVVGLSVPADIVRGIW